MNKYEFWTVRYKYEDCENIEIRPVLIVNNINFYVCIKATTKQNHEDIFPVYYWREAGLSEMTYLRLSKVLKLEEKDFVEKIGNMHQNDIMRLEIELALRLKKFR